MIVREEFASDRGEGPSVVERETQVIDLRDTPEVMTIYIPSIPLRESAFYKFAKRSMDIIVASSALVLLSPLFVTLAALIYLQDRGPIFYRQPRVGRYGLTFPFYKFRSMRVDADKIRHELLKHSDAEGAAFKMKNDPRITKIGRVMRKFSMDELPQLVTVLSGHMSIIGPRPHLREEVRVYEPHQYVRLMVKPGLLCLREVRGRSDISFEEWVRLDLEYVENRSLLLDLKILGLAVPAVIQAKGAY